MLDILVFCNLVLQTVFATNILIFRTMTWVYLSVHVILILLPGIFATPFGTCQATDSRDHLISFAIARVTCQDTLLARVRMRLFCFQSYFRLRGQFFSSSYKELFDEFSKLDHQAKELQETLDREIENIEDEVRF